MAPKDGGQIVDSREKNAAAGRKLSSSPHLDAFNCLSNHQRTGSLVIGSLLFVTKKKL